MWCEEVPLHESRVGTVVMFNPAATMRIFRWWEGDGRWELPGRHRSEQMSPETKELLAAYPTLLQEEPWDAQPFITLRHDVIDPLLAQAHPQARKSFAELSWSGPNFPLYVQDACKKVNERDAYNNGAWAYLFMGHEQGAVLSWFPREVQRQLATWQLQFPLRHLQGVPMTRCVLGFYPESEHSLWKKLYASQTSRGVSAGMGVVINPKDDSEDKRRFALQSYTY